MKLKTNRNHTGASGSGLASTHHQRAALRSCMRQLELPTDCITLLHRRHYEAAGVAMPAVGVELNAALCALSCTRASRLIEVLRAEQESLT